MFFNENQSILPDAMANRRCVSFMACYLLWAAIQSTALCQPWSATQNAGPVNETAAVLNGMVTPNGQPTTAWFEWGTNVNYGRVTGVVDAGQGFQVIRTSAEITGLAVGTVYHCRLVSSNALGVVYGGDQRWITGGKLVSWGSVQPRDWLGRLAMIAVKSICTVAVRTDGTVIGWGQPGSSQPSPPRGLSNIVAAACGWSHGLALKADGSVVSWGKASLQTRVPQGLSHVVAIACSRDDSLALKADGTLVVWGQNASKGAKVPEGLTNVVAVAGGNSLFVALKADGTVVAWGPGCYGASMIPAGLSNVVAVAAGFGHCLALKADGQVVACGLNSLGQTDVPAGLSNVIAIACGDMHSFAFKADGTITAWGLNASGETNIPPGLHDPGAIAAGPHHCVAIRALELSDFKPYSATQPAWNVSATHATLNGMALPNGNPSVAWFEWGTDTNYGCETAVTGVGSGFNVVRVSAVIDGLTPGTIYHYRLVASNALDVAYGEDTLVATGLRVASWGWIAEPPITASNAVAIAAGDRHCLALKTDSTVVAWGTSFGGAAVTNVPPGLSNVVEMAAGIDVNLVLKSDGTVSQWGTYLYSSIPATALSGLSNVIAVAASRTHCLVLKADGTVFAWSSSSSLCTNVPGGLDNVVAIQAGDDHSLALRCDGTVVGWGGSMFNPSSMPTNLSPVVAISAKEFTDMALLSNGSVVSWNVNNGQWTEYRQPSAGPDRVIAIANGALSGLFLQANGTVYPWGSNSIASATVPAGLAQVAAVTADYGHYEVLTFNTPPQLRPRPWSVSMNGDRIIPAPCVDPNGDPLTFKIVSLPERGQLYQYTSSGRGEAVLAPDTTVTDPEGRVVFAPSQGEYGLSYASFSVVGNDGEYDSAPGTATLNVIPPPQWQPLDSGLVSGGQFQMSFIGYTNFAHGVWASTNLKDWIRLGWTSEPAPGQFTYTDADAANYPQRFYQLRLP